MSKQSTAEAKKGIGRLCLLSLLSLLLFMPAMAQQKKLSGKVVNAANNQPVVNASISIKGATGRTTVTDELGGFAITISSGETLVVSSVGFQTREVKYTNQVVLTVQLSENVEQLQDVVVTALGIKREEKGLGYAVGKVNNEQLTDALSNNWSNALQGKVAGINILKSGGGPAGSNRIVLRGETSLSGGGEALIVIDGVIVSGSSGKLTGSKGSGSYLDSDSPTDFGSSLSDINPEDIESVTVLKGPGAAALYGSRGANGAIMITTKSGRGAQKGLGITFNSNTTLETISRWPDYQYEYGQGAAGQDTWYSYNATADGASTRSTSSAWGPKFDGQKYFQYDPVTRTTGAQRTDWVPYKNNHKDFFQTGKTYTNSVTVEGGNSNGTSARFSYTNLKNTWIIPNTGYSRNTVALSVNQKVSDKLQIATKINYTNRSSDNLPSTGYNNQTIMYFIRGLTPNMDMNWFKDYWAPGQVGLVQTRPFSSLLDNPYLQAYEMLNKSNRNGVVGNISATYNLSKEFSLMVRSSIDFSAEARSQQRPKNTNKFADGMYRTQNIYAQEITTDFLARYNRKINSDFTVNASVGGSSLKNKYIRDEVRADKLLYPGIFTFANSKVVPVSLPYRSQYAVNSLYGLAQLSYKNRYFIDYTGRNDWTSVLATPTSPGNSSFYYQSVNASAILSEAFKLPAFVSYLKLRASYSSVGSGGTDPYLTAYVYNPTLFPSGLSNPTSIANPDLKPLRTVSKEIGTEAKLFGSRLTLDVAVYENNTNDQITPIPIDRAAGYNSTVLNMGTVRNRGIEVQVNGTVIKSKTKNGLNWSLYGTYSSNRSKILSLPADLETMVLSTGPANRGSIEARNGGRMGDLYGLGYERSPDGQIVYNAQGIPVLGQTIKYLGNTTPDWKGSLGSEFRYKQFRLNLLFDAQFGAVGYSLTTAVLSEEGKLTKTLPGRYNGITGVGVQMNPDGTYRPNDVMATNIQAYYNGHFNRDNVEANTFSTDFIKFREARLDYTFSPALLKKLRLQRATIGVYGRDLLMFTNWPAFDPEFGTLGSNANGDGVINAGFEIGQFPSTRSFGVNLVVGF
ncbi:SusC/RagA family TonB-linked outer membrane protein [Sediminibacterium ginsengisoli]|uniref:TonB-linked outer membrane protein, SusC/RagA family n=1 Tax=Sediminibacterium ginsengisoli TaxID=413434 RepID=A0A1T4M3H1_9BACT|nr:SusC/RagA family TonB-linked outer membrane protein [Sediminibacterium ginsengisoli]SJZ61540.1 TonB-linked outer membrane protein, SusC/RagA family [Sediminibacterium ginsengisoli]